MRAVALRISKGKSEARGGLVLAVVETKMRPCRESGLDRRKRVSAPWRAPPVPGRSSSTSKPSAVLTTEISASGPCRSEKIRKCPRRESVSRGGTRVAVVDAVGEPEDFGTRGEFRFCQRRQRVAAVGEPGLRRQRARGAFGAARVHEIRVRLDPRSRRWRWAGAGGRPERTASSARPCRAFQFGAAVQPLSTNRTMGPSAGDVQRAADLRFGQRHDQRRRGHESQQHQPPGRARRSLFLVAQSQQQIAAAGNTTRRGKGGITRNRNQIAGSTRAPARSTAPRSLCLPASPCLLSLVPQPVPAAEIGIKRHQAVCGERSVRCAK